MKVRADLGIATPYEELIVNSPAHNFLLHIEGELHSSKSYKIATLHALLHLARHEEKVSGEWSVGEIAPIFLAYYEGDLERRADWPALKETDTGTRFPMSKVEQHLLNMPLYFLSDNADKFFNLDKELRQFRLKASVQPFWKDQRFRDLVRERVEYAEARYWYGKSKSQSDAPHRLTAS